MISLWASAPASAMEHGDTAPVQKLRVEVKATIAAHCGFDQASDVSTKALDLNLAQTLHIPLKLDCNTPFIIGVKSSHGGLVSTLTPDHSGFSFVKAYKVALQVGVDGSPLSPDACDAVTLTGIGNAGRACAFYGDAPGVGLSSGKHISIGQPSQLSVGWDAAGRGPRNVAGHYQDTLTVIVAARS